MYIVIHANYQPFLSDCNQN